MMVVMKITVLMQKSMGRELIAKVENYYKITDYGETKIVNHRGQDLKIMEILLEVIATVQKDYKAIEKKKIICNRY